MGSAACEAGPDAEGSGDDGERGEAVGAGVVAVGDERGGSDARAFADAVERDELVAEEADDASGGDPSRDSRWLRGDETADRFDGRRRSRTA